MLLRENPILCVTVKGCTINSAGAFVLSLQEYVKVWPGNGFADEISDGALTLKNPVIDPNASPFPATLQTGVRLGEKNFVYVELSEQVAGVGRAAVLWPAKDTKVPGGPAANGGVSHTTCA